jgi:hypothetical protein
MFNKPASRDYAWFVEHQSQTLAGQQSVMECITMIVMILVTPKAAAKHELLFNKLRLVC